MNYTDSDNFTALMWAAANGHEDCIKLLVDAGARVNMTNNKGSTALLEAAMYGYLGCGAIPREFRS